MSSKRYEPDELALLFKRLFSTQDGADVLHVLEQRFAKTSLIPQVNDGAALVPLTFARIGEDNVIKYINSLINRQVTND